MNGTAVKDGDDLISRVADTPVGAHGGVERRPRREDR